jgi:hypothetical protein
LQREKAREETAAERDHIAAEDDDDTIGNRRTGGGERKRDEGEVSNNWRGSRDETDKQQQRRDAGRQRWQWWRKGPRG